MVWARRSQSKHDDLVNQRGSEGSGVVAHLQAIFSRLHCSTMIEEIPGGFPSHTERSTHTRVLWRPS